MISFLFIILLVLSAGVPSHGAQDASQEGMDQRAQTVLANEAAIESIEIAHEGLTIDNS